MTCSASLALTIKYLLDVNKFYTVLFYKFFSRFKSLIVLGYFMFVLLSVHKKHPCLLVGITCNLCTLE
jgi:hypothetical protein